nr:MAG TPA: hypothetical protein [Microviridae sp.]
MEGSGSAKLKRITFLPVSGFRNLDLYAGSG